VSGKAVIGDGCIEARIPSMLHGPPSAAGNASLFDLNVEKVGYDERVGPNILTFVCYTKDRRATQPSKAGNHIDVCV
jgi:hypothetical protein